VRGPDPGTCGNCGAGLHGRWCAQCGQEALEEGDRRLSALVGQFVQELLRIDGKLPRSLGALLFRPGLLSRRYLAGQRIRYVSPVGLFLLVNLVYFVAAPLTDFNLSLDEQLHFQPYSRWVQPVVEERVEARGIELRAYAAEYDRLAGRLARSLIIVHLPLLALVLMLLFRGRRTWYAEHFVVACHLFTFLLALVVIWYGALLAGRSLVSEPGLVAALRITSVVVPLVLLFHWLVALRRTYGTGWLRSLAGLGGWVLGLGLVHLVIYRPMQFLLVFALT
jgi:hypothetical protein